jgi:GNAT superfamily N-acetyltransferase
MNFLIRPAQPADASQIAHVQVESWNTTYRGIVPDSFLAYLTRETQTERWLPHLADPAAHFFVAESDSSVFGFINGGQLREPLVPEQGIRYDAELYALYLLQSHQRQGAGRALTRALAMSLHAKGFQSMAVWALEVNPAVEFYKRLGALPLTRKFINIGGKDLSDLALGWPTLDSLL